MLIIDAVGLPYSIDSGRSVVISGVTSLLWLQYLRIVCESVLLRPKSDFKPPKRDAAEVVCHVLAAVAGVTFCDPGTYICVSLVWQAVACYIAISL